MVSPLSPLWDARSVAVVGATERTGALGGLPVAFLQRYGYGGRILPVNPSADTVHGLPAHPSVAAARQATGEPVDLALVMVGAARVPDAIDDCAAAGVPVAVVMSSGFAEAGAEGAALQEEAVRRARAGGVRLVGPNCIGTVGFAAGQVSSFSPLFSAQDVPMPAAGSVGFVSQSGALGYGAVSLALARGLGLGWAVNTGNEADVDAVEVLTELAGLDELPRPAGLRRVAHRRRGAAGARRHGEAGRPAQGGHVRGRRSGRRLAHRGSRGERPGRRRRPAPAAHRPRPRRRRAARPGRRVRAAPPPGRAAGRGGHHQRGVRHPRRGRDRGARPRARVVLARHRRRPRGDRPRVRVGGEPGRHHRDRDERPGAVRPVPRRGRRRRRRRRGRRLLLRAHRRRRRPDGRLAGTGRRSGRASPCSSPAPAPTSWRRRPRGPCARRASRPTRRRPARCAPSPPSGRPGREVRRAATGAAARPAPAAGSGEVELKAMLADAGMPVPRSRLATGPDDASAAVEEVGGRAVLKAVVPGMLAQDRGRRRRARRDLG